MYRRFTGHVPSPRRITTSRGGTSWQFRYVDPSGIERAVNRPTKVLAEQEAQRVRIDLATGRDPTKGRGLTVQYVHEFIEAVEADAEVARRRGAILVNLRVHVLPRFGSTPLRDITPKLIEVWIGDLARTELRPATVRGIYGALSAFMTWAFREGHISATPCRGKVPTMPKIERREFVLTDANVAQLHDAFPPRYQAMVRVAALACLRAGEVRGLAWQDIDARDHRITVRRQMLHGGPYIEPTFAPPKARTWEDDPEVVHVHPSLIAALVEHRANYHVDNPWDLVFTTENGAAVSQDALNRMWRVARGRAGCPTARFHDLRHYGVSKMLANRDVPIPEAALQARHKDGGALMMKVYAHVLGDDRSRSAGSLRWT